MFSWLLLAVALGFTLLFAFGILAVKIVKVILFVVVVLFAVKLVRGRKPAHT